MCLKSECTNVTDTVQYCGLLLLKELACEHEHGSEWILVLYNFVHGASPEMLIFHTKGITL